MVFYASCITLIFVMHYNASFLMVMHLSEVAESEVEREKWTSIRVRRETAKMLKELGRKGETYDDVIRKLLSRVRRRRRG